MATQKVAIVHDYLNQHGGAENTLEAICELYPDAPIYTGIYKPNKVHGCLKDKRIISSSGLLTKTFPKYLTFMMPLVFEGFDLRRYDLVISSGTAWAKSVLTTPNQLHLGYIYTPPRFLYNYSSESSKRNKWYFKPVIPVLDHYLRAWDYVAAQRPDYLATDSEEARKRINKFYRRDARVIYPPVEITYPETNDNPYKEWGSYYAAVGRLCSYKNFDVLIEAFNMLGKTLVILGTGTEERKLKALAGPTVKLLGRTSDSEKHAILANCKGLINPVVDEDLGIVPIEAMYHGKPVLVHKSGGHLETVKEGIGGMFFGAATVESIVAKMKDFERAIDVGQFKKELIIESVKHFSKAKFKKEFGEFVTEKIEAHQRTEQASNA